MTGLQIVVLAVVQGLTEFLPISSSGHLVLVPVVFGWSDQGLAFDVAVHFGSLGAVCLFFRRELAALLRGTAQLAARATPTLESRMALGIGLGTVPAALAGLAFGAWIEANLRDPAVIVVTLSGYGVLMLLADRLGRKSRTVADLTITDALLIGCAQALALVPGTSRSGVTMTAAMTLGFTRQDAARFSFVLAVPVILLATGYELVGLVAADAPVPWSDFGLAAVISGIVAYLSIEFFMRFVSYIGLLPFAIYRLLLAAIIVYVLV